MRIGADERNHNNALDVALRQDTFKGVQRKSTAPDFFTTFATKGRCWGEARKRSKTLRTIRRIY